MTIAGNERAVWQIPAGPADRSYADQFLDHGVALLKPGDAGPWCSGRPDEEFEGGSVRRFATELRVGDILLLRTGLATICAVGLVASDYHYLPQFDDLNGWDLQHGRRVRWVALPEPYDFGGYVFGANPPRLSRVQSEDVVGYAHRFVRSPPTDWQTRALPNLPAEEPELKTVPFALRELVAQVRDLSVLYWDTDAFGERPMEDELVAHYVVPFLRMLGWSAERIAVKWNRADVSLFFKLPRVPKHCYYLIEAKRLGAGIEGASDQAIGYVSALGIQCDVVVTDGIRYRMYEGARNFVPVAYANLARLKQSALELFARMRRPLTGEKSWIHGTKL